jgi:hypothetical protein
MLILAPSGLSNVRSGPILCSCWPLLLMSARALLSDGIDGFAPALLVAPTAKGSIQTLLVGDPPVSAAKHLEELLEDYPAGYAGAVANSGRAGRESVARFRLYFVGYVTVKRQGI